MGLASSFVVLLLLLLLPELHATSQRAAALATQKLLQASRRAQAHLIEERRQSLLSQDDVRVVLAAELGADPTGQEDSTIGIQLAIDRAFNMTTSHSLIGGIPDLGSVELHLEGGTYLVSRPLRFPDSGGGNLVIHSGSLRASATFPTDGYLVDLSTSSGSSASYPYEDITFRDLMLDCQMRGGGLRISNSLRISVDNLYVTGFTSEGILVQRGHETYVSNTFVGQHITAGGDRGERSFGGVGISLAGNDNVVSNCVVFSAAVGIAVQGQANLLQGNHLYNKATGFGGIGIHVQLPGLSQTRVLGCYLDFTAIVADAPAQLHVSGCFFLGDANIVLQSTAAGQSLRSVMISGNTFSGSGRGTPTVVLAGDFAFDSVDGLLVDANTADGMQLKATRAQATLRSDNATTRWTLDLSSTLLLPSAAIRSVHYSLYCPGHHFPGHALRSVANNTITVETDVAVVATVSVLVDQSGSGGGSQSLY